MKTGLIAAATGAALTLSGAVCFLHYYEKGCIPTVPHVGKPNAKKCRVACVGASITYGCGVAHWSRNNYPAVLSRLSGPAYCVKNFGCSGRTVSPDGDHPYIREKSFKSSLRFLPDAVFLMMGTNDSKPYNWRGAETFKKEYLDLVRAYQALPSDPAVFLITLPPAWPLDDEPVRYDIRADVIEREIRPAIISLSEEEGLPLIDMFSVFSGRPELFPDGVHPNAEGARLIAQTAFTALPMKGKIV